VFVLPIQVKILPLGINLPKLVVAASCLLSSKYAETQSAFRM
jgi:hypothetical protein